MENVQLPLMYAGATRIQQQDRARELLTTVGRHDRLKHHSNQLSGGPQQRVTMVRALAHRPALLLPDEPTGNVDSESGSEILSIFEELHRQGLTSVMFTHDPLIAQRADRRIPLRDDHVMVEEFPATGAHPTFQGI